MAYKITTYVKEQTGGVFLIVSFKGKRFHISTGMKSLTKFAGSEFPATEPNHKAKTSRLRRFYCECEDYILQHPADSAERVKSALKAIVSGKEAAGGGGRPLHEYISEFGGTHNKSTADIYLTTAKRVRDFDAACNLGDVDKKWLEAYRAHELGRVGKLSVVKNKRGAYVKKSIEPLFPGITWYTARRSWATAAASLDIPKETIGKALGHSEWDNTTTDIYITFDNRKIDEANRRVLDLIK